MKEDKSIFLKVDSIEPVIKGGGICSGETYLDGVKVWIGNYGYFFPCDLYTICEPDVVREDGRRQVVELVKELTDMLLTDKNKLFGNCSTSEILSRFSYEEIVVKLDAWKKEKDKIKIRVKDEVTTGDITFVVTKMYSYYVDGLGKGGGVFRGILANNIRKTGLHVDDLDSYLEV